MSPIELVNNEYITLEYYPDRKLVYHTIHKPIGNQVEMFQNAMNAGTEALKKYGCCKWLSDDRKNGPLPAEIIQWGFEDWNPRTIKAGWKYWANVVPHEVAAAGTLAPVIEDLYQLGLRMQVFTSTEDALRWLDSM